MYAFNFDNVLYFSFNDTLYHNEVFCFKYNNINSTVYQCVHAFKTVIVENVLVSY